MRKKVLLFRSRIGKFQKRGGGRTHSFFIAFHSLFKSGGKRPPISGRLVPFIVSFHDLRLAGYLAHSVAKTQAAWTTLLSRRVSGYPAARLPMRLSSSRTLIRSSAVNDRQNASSCSLSVVIFTAVLSILRPRPSVQSDSIPSDEHEVHALSQKAFNHVSVIWI